ncbi:hypothetical protein [Erwinia psidii]|uniref:hypothetical protein n=1 Tax=Erwinia psidii TaxID=69224 RepID=UPI00226BA5DB|nr:hypothetical protein [Erwinia psidii]
MPFSPHHSDSSCTHNASATGKIYVCHTVKLQPLEWEDRRFFHQANNKDKRDALPVQETL